MKKIILRSLLYIILIITFLILGIIGYLNKPADIPNSKILNIDYYRFDTTTGEYDKIRLTSKTVEYEGNKLNLNNCKEYTFAESTGIIKFDCKKAIRIVAFTDDILVLTEEIENLYYYKDKEKAYKGEFQRKYKMTFDTYKKEGEDLLKEIEIDLDNLLELTNEKDTSYVYIKNSNCQNECTLFNKTFMNFSSNNNLYYLNTDKLNQEEIVKLNELLKNSTINVSYPLVLKINDKEIEIIKIEASGFDYSKYDNYANSLEVENE